jgi:hypothetical protein
MAVQGKGKAGDSFSSPPSGAARKGAVAGDAPPRMQADATGPAAEAKRSELADRVDTAAAMTNVRGWKIFAGLITSFLLVASAVVLFAMYWT